MIEADQFYTLEEVSVLLNISLSNVIDLVQRGNILCHESKGFRRISGKDLQQYLNNLHATME